MRKIILKIFIALLFLCLLSAPVSAGTERVVNGDFSQDGTGWTKSVSTGSSGTATITYSSSELVTQDLAVYFTAVTQGDYVYASLSQNIDLSYVDNLTFKLIDIGGEQYSGYDKFSVKIGDTTVWQQDVYSLSGDWLTYTVDVSSYSGSYNVAFTLTLNSIRNAHQCKVGLTDVSAYSLAEPPTYIRGSVDNFTLTTATPVTASITVDGGYPATQISVNWGDGTGTEEVYTTQGEFTAALSHTYNTPGTYSITASAHNTYGSSGSQFIAQVEVVHLDFSAYPTSGDPPLIVQFSVSAQNIASLLWDFGDGTTSTAENPVHTYSASSTPYTVTLTGYTIQGNAVPVVKQNYIVATAQSVTWNASSYTAGDTASISWSLRDPDFTSYDYTLQILASDSQGNTVGNSIITPYEINSATGTYTWNTSGYAGYYTAAIYRSGNPSPLTFGVANIIKEVTLTVNLATSGSTYTNETTITLTKDGSIIATQTTSTGQTQFVVPTGTYLVSATTTGYATQSATVTLLESTAITIDFVTGTTDSVFPSGSGSFYQSTFATFRVVDKKYGTELEGATITGYAVEATNPVEWLANIYGQAWGGKIIGSEVYAITDSEGLASFMMFTNVRYSLTLTHPDLPNPVTRTFALTSLSTEYPWYIDIPHEKDPTSQTSISTTAAVSSNGIINITYTDTSKTTSTVVVEVFQKDDQNNYTILMDTTSGIGNTNDLSLQLVGYEGANIKIIITANTGAFGTVERNYYHTFPGPWFDLGLPAGMYIWICLLTAVLLGGISPFVNSYACCFVICFFEWVYWFFGWFFEIGQPTAALLLATATVLSIIYYIASRR